MESFTVDDENAWYSSLNGVLYNKEMTEIVAVPRTIKTFTVPENITSLGGSCFYGCSVLTSITLPESLTSLGDYCFNDCDGLTSITLPESLTSLGMRCFASCKNLEVKCYWTDLSDVETGIELLTSNARKCKLYVPKGTKEMYASTEPWNDFGEIIEFEDDAASIGSTLYKDLKVNVSGSNIYVSGLKSGESVNIYSVGGALLGTTTASAGTATLNAGGESIVIVKIGEQTFKVQM